jgi:two-component system, OmpR family, sensor histidine kinase KdpD
MKSLTPIRDYSFAIVACLATAALAKPLTAWIDPANLVMLFLLTVFLVAWLLGRGPAMLAAFLNVALFDFFFVPPYLTLAVANAQYLITFFVMLAVAIVTGHLTALRGEHARESRERERRTHALYGMARELAGAVALEQVAESTRRLLRGVARVETALLVPDATGHLRIAGEPLSEQADMTLPMRAYERGEPVEKRGPSGRGGCTLYLPMTAPMRVRGVLEAYADADTLHAERPLLNTVASLTGIAVERLHYVEVARDAEVSMASERLRNTVLASLSHDLRTPLTALVGLAETLTLTQPPLPPHQAETARALHEQATTLNGMVDNLLDLARLATGGGMTPRKEWQVLEEVVGSALKPLASVLSAHPVEIDLPADLPLLEFDAVLIERVFANLLDNAAKHAPAGSPIRIEARPVDAMVEVSVLNAGPGFPSGLDLTMPFARGGLRPGTGLGLAIAKAIVEAHGGRLRLDNPPEGGARVRFDLPRGHPPALADASA